MGGKVDQRAFTAGISKKHMAGALGIGSGHPRSEGESADLFERPGNTIRVTRELYGRGICQIFALPGERGLDQTGEKKTDCTDNQRGDS